MHRDTRQLHHLSRAFRILFIYFFLYLVVIALFFISPFTFFIMGDMDYNEPLFIFAAFLVFFLLAAGIYHYREAPGMEFLKTTQYRQTAGSEYECPYSARHLAGNDYPLDPLALWW